MLKNTNCVNCSVTAAYLKNTTIVATLEVTDQHIKCLHLKPQEQQAFLASFAHNRVPQISKVLNIYIIAVSDHGKL